MQVAFLEQDSPFALSDALVLHGELAGPEAPKYPEKHSPQVLVTVVHGFRFNVLHGVGTVQSTVLTEFNPAFNVKVIALGSLLVAILAKLDVTS
jgi:hypothetical protein